MNLTILANTYYEKLPGKWSNYFQEEYEKIRTKDVDPLGEKNIIFKENITELCTQRYIICKTEKNLIFLKKMAKTIKLPKWFKEEWKIF